MTAVQTHTDSQLRSDCLHRNRPLAQQVGTQESLRLQLAETTDLFTIAQLTAEAREAADRGSHIRIDCEDVSSVDLGALQLLRKLINDLPATKLAFQSSQQAKMLNGWLQLIDAG